MRQNHLNKLARLASRQLQRQQHAAGNINGESWGWWIAYVAFGEELRGASRKICIAFATPSRSRSLHSHTTMTCHPDRRKASNVRVSRNLLPLSFTLQKSIRDLGMRADLHPSCRCQKHPCTKMTFLLPGNIKSGEPRRSLT